MKKSSFEELIPIDKILQFENVEKRIILILKLNNLSNLDSINKCVSIVILNKFFYIKMSFNFIFLFQINLRNILMLCLGIKFRRSLEIGSLSLNEFKHAVERDRYKFD